MTRESCVKHPARNPTVVLRDDYLKLCNGDYCAAMVLSQHEHWLNVKLDSRQQAVEHNQAAVRSAEVPTQDTELWVYMAQACMKAQLMAMFGDKAVTTAYKTILDKGFLQKRKNPRYTWDKTLQYLFMVERVQEAIDGLAPLVGDGDDAEIYESASLQGSRAHFCALDTAEVRHAERKDADCKTQECTTPKTTPKTSDSETKTKNLPPPGAVEEPEEEEDSVGVKDAENCSERNGEAPSDEEAARADDMLAQIMKITQTSIDIEDMRPSALECVRREHKDAWKHTLGVLKNKMACDKKPTIPNKFASTVLANALKSPCKPVPSSPQPAAREEPSQAGGLRPAQDDVQGYYDALPEAERQSLDDEARRRVKPELRKSKGIVKANRDELIRERLATNST